MKRTYDIITNGNMISGRQGWAYICNSGEVKVLEADMEKPQEYDTYETFGKAKVVNHRGNAYTCTLARSKKDEKWTWSFGSAGTCIHSDFGYSDAMELVENAQLAKIEEGDIVAIAKHTSDKVALELFRLSRVNSGCMTVATLKELTEEEMIEVGTAATRWVEGLMRR